MLQHLDTTSTQVTIMHIIFVHIGNKTILDLVPFVILKTLFDTYDLHLYLGQNRQKNNICALSLQLAAELYCVSQHLVAYLQIKVQKNTITCACFRTVTVVGTRAGIVSRMVSKHLL